MMKISSSFSHSSKVLAFVLLLTGGADARAADLIASYSRMGEGFIGQGLFVSRHFYKENLLEKALILNNEGDRREISFAEHHRTDLRWHLGYEVNFTDLALTETLTGTLEAQTDPGHEVRAALGWHGEDGSVDLLIDGVMNFISPQQYRSGRFTFTAGYVTRLKSFTDTFGITDEKDVEQPRTVEDYERELLKAKKHVRGFSHPYGLEPLLDEFKFDFRFPTLYFGMALEATRHEQERFHSSAANFEAFQRRLGVAAGYSDESFSAGFIVHAYGYNTDVESLASRLATNLKLNADYRGFIAKVAVLPSLILEGSIYFRPSSEWELGTRLFLTQFELEGVPMAFTAAPSIGKKFGPNWSAALGGEMTLSSGSSSLSGNLFVAYYL